MTSKPKILFLARPNLFSQSGGDTVHIEQTAKWLSKLGYDIEIHTSTNLYKDKFDLLHFFNLGRPEQMLPYLKYPQPKVISSIYVKYNEVNKRDTRLLIRLSEKISTHWAEYFKTVGRYIKSERKLPPLSYLILGQRIGIERVLQKADALITASQSELEIIRKDFIKIPSLQEVIHLGTEHFPPLTGVENKSGVISIARIEPLKNQLNLIEAVKNSGIKTRIIGGVSHHHLDYFKTCQNNAGKEVDFLPHSSLTEVSALLKESKVHVLPSFFETTGLATLEALASGCQVVVSDREIQREIFGNRAHYCDPSQPVSILNAIKSAMRDERDHRDWTRENFSWRNAADQLQTIYQKLISQA